MSWARVTDDAGSYPKLVAVEGVEDAPPAAKTLMMGFITLLACMSTSHNSDYVVNRGHLRAAGSELHEWLTVAACTTGLLTKLKQKVNGVDAWKVIDDPDFIHIRLKAEKDWENQQRNDTNDLAVSVPVRLRDGDLCRYCGVLTYWTGGNPKSRRKGTLDHLRPGEPAKADTMVVACLGCNSSLKNEEEGRRPLKPPPLVAFYSRYTAKWLTLNGYPTTPTASDPSSDPHPADDALIPAQRPVSADTARPAASDPASAGNRAATRPPGHAHPPPLTADSSSVLTTDQVVNSHSAGSGRVGSGQVVPGRVGSGSRRRRSRRSRPRSSDPNPRKASP